MSRYLVVNGYFFCGCSLLLISQSSLLFCTMCICLNGAMEKVNVLIEQLLLYKKRSFI